MEHGSVNLLLIGESERSFPAVDRGQEKKGFCWWFAAAHPLPSIDEARVECEDGGTAKSARRKRHERRARD